MTALPYLDGDTLMSLVSWSEAIAALEAALSAGAASSDGPPRTAVPTAGGELLLMPAETATSVGVKLASVAPGNPAAGLPRVQAVYVLFDAATLTPRIVLDGTALTTLRTPALSALAVRDLAVADAASLVVFGAGPQAWGHVHAIAAIRPIRAVTVVGRSDARTADLVARLRAEGVDAVGGAPDAVRDADVTVCATTAQQPLFDGQLVPEHGCVVAVGSHTPQDRELDDVVFERAARVVVEQREIALREAGDIIAAVAAGALSADRLTDLADLSGLPRVGGVGVFKSVGMGWQDLAVAEVAYALWRDERS